ncbi:hypothetical protein HIM_04761 [Hirsutella minnesotensis 3608]|uniref:Uncharacterized protein n=1 Tax=Hirsutella minnesotensis 3608 TaxID=1043627 RepID=A0A0F8A167_9HYPO|nr:hypothetical protein HIM_04761 [Hirsutella minnesotensis 3608]
MGCALNLPAGDNACTGGDWRSPTPYFVPNALRNNRQPVAGRSRTLSGVWWTRAVAVEKGAPAREDRRHLRFMSIFTGRGVAPDATQVPDPLVVSQATLRCGQTSVAPAADEAGYRLDHSGLRAPAEAGSA